MISSREITYEIEENTNCFICTSHKPDSNGYPLIWRNGTQLHIHRWIYQFIFDKIPNNKVVHHVCENKLCINYQHLEIKTISIHNSEHHQGESNEQSKLIESQIKEILVDKEHTQNELSKIYGVSQPHISLIKHRGTWNHVVI